MKRWFVVLGLMLLSTAAAAAEVKQTAPLEGRVEHIQAGAEPLLPSDLALDAGVQEDQLLPTSLQGRWFGTVKITQMDTYPSLHAGEPYCEALTAEIGRVFQRGMKGELQLDIVPDPRGGTRIASSDIFFGRRGKLNLTAHRGPGLVYGYYHIPRTVKNEVRKLTDKIVEQSRYDAVQLVNGQNIVMDRAFTEVSSQYNHQAAGRLYVKVLNVDYDRKGQPVWKALMEGYLYK